MSGKGHEERGEGIKGTWRDGEFANGLGGTVKRVEKEMEAM